ncbi:MAG: DUF4202 domain-containing protein [Methylophilaceae bacterium]|nr:DUF4202 domain-containing protein [Methylophilaceae bacterium]MDG1453962.1 DUF4202 domain-containing protein [Methylophilaceae bacterium]
MKDQTRFNNTITSFDAINAQDPNQINIDGKPQPKELVYAARLSEMLNRYAPEASEALKLAVRAQHIQRWISPRSDYPMTKPGYMQWRSNLKKHHAELASKVMQEQGYDAETIEQVASLLKKENLSTNADTQTLEDVIVLAFLEHDLADFVEKYSDYTEEKFLTILRKSYLKMSEQGRAAALTLITIPENLVPVVLKAVG